MNMKKFIIDIAFTFAMTLVAVKIIHPEEPSNHGQTSIRKELDLPLVECLVVGTASGQSAKNLEFLIVALREHGYKDGKNITLRRRFANGDPSRLHELAAEAVSARATVIVAISELAAEAAKKATHVIPVVFITTTDPVEGKLIASLDQSDNNLTGVTAYNPELEANRVTLLRELLPEVKRLAIIVNGDYPSTGSFESTASRATSLGLRNVPVLISNEYPLDESTLLTTSRQVDAAIVLFDPVTIGQMKRVTALAAKYRLPMVYPLRDFVDVGGLMSYGPNFPDLFKDAARYVVQILKGKKPIDLPSERSKRFEFVLNAAAARVIEINVPQSLLKKAKVVRP